MKIYSHLQVFCENTSNIIENLGSFDIRMSLKPVLQQHIWVNQSAKSVLHNACLT